MRILKIDTVVARAAQLWVEAMPEAEVPEHSEFIHLLSRAAAARSTSTGRSSVPGGR
jgi:hypothetical protein